MNLRATPRSRLWLGMPAVLVMLVVWTSADYPLDYWLHVASGRWMAEQGQLVTVDEFSHTIGGQPVLNQPWLAQLVMYQLHERGGYALNQFAAGAGYALAAFLATWLAWRHGANSAVAAGLGLVAVAAMATNLGVRTQWFSAVLFAVELVLLCTARRTTTAAAAALAIAALWTNLHGAFPLAVALPALFAVGALATTDRTQKWRRCVRYAAATVAAAVGVLVRPDPQNSLAYVLGVSSKSVARGLEEWLPPALDRNFGALFFATIAAALIVLALSRRRLALGEIILAGPFFLLAVQSQRMILWWGLVLPLVLARPAASAWRRLAPRSRRESVCHGRVASAEAANEYPLHTGDTPVAHGVASPLHTRSRSLAHIADALAALSLLGFLAMATPWTRIANPLLPPAKRQADPAEAPRELADALISLGPVRTYSPLPWASYFTWRTDGDAKSFVDSRVDFFPDDVWRDYVQIAQGGPAALALLDHHEVNAVVVETAHEALANTLRSSGVWTQIAGTEGGAVLARTTR